MANIIKVAITGGIGSGKSKVLQIAGELGYAAFSCDDIYKSVIQSGAYIEKIKTEFPYCIENDQINRKKLAEIVFSNKKDREKLNDIAHPLIMNALFTQMNASTTTIAFAEVPLLFEGNYENAFDYIIVVQRSISERVEAIKQRDGLSNTEIKSRIQTQIDYESKEMQARIQKNNIFVIENNGTVEQLKAKLLDIIFKI